MVRLYLIIQPEKVKTKLPIRIPKSMKIDRHRLLRALVAQDLWKKLSPMGIRLYLLFVIFVDEASGKGKLSKEELKGYLGHNLSGKQFKKTARTFLKLGLAEINYSSGESEIEFKFS